MGKRWTIYGLKDPRTSEICYVGVTCDLLARMRNHRQSLKKEYTPKALWLKSLAAVGLEPVCSVLEANIEDWATAERIWIARLTADGCPLTNATRGGSG